MEEPSSLVFKEIGTHSVAEASALAAAGEGGFMLAPKRKSHHATAALAISPIGKNLGAESTARGRLMLIGIGPGKAAWRTPEATAMVREADELVGYGLYLDLLGADKPRKDFALGEEEARARYALEEAARGQKIALICSGDAGVYAMGALVFELLDRPENAGGVSAAARRVEVQTTRAFPRITPPPPKVAHCSGMISARFRCRICSPHGQKLKPASPPPPKAISSSLFTTRSHAAAAKDSPKQKRFY